MTLFQESGGDPRATTAQLADVLTWYGAIGDAAFGNPSGFCNRKTSIAVALCEIAHLPSDEAHATFFAGMLHAIGSIENDACRKDSDLSERIARVDRWDIPVQGARMATQIEALPPLCADLIRWQAECWDGTGYPDQLRWHGIPRCAQFLAIADAFLRCDDPEEALGTIGMQSGRAFGPEAVGTFVIWFHSSGGEDSPTTLPLDALSPGASAEALLDEIADRVDRHNGVAGRWRRIEAAILATARALNCDDDAIRTLKIAARIYGAGEIGSRSVEDSGFDPLARLGIDDRAGNATRAGALSERIVHFGDVANTVRARAEWYDGTGKPTGAMHRAIPIEARILAAAIAHERLDRAERLEEAVGTQFDPAVVRALFASRRTRA